ncbi:MAG: hypothetical protein ABFQ62_04510 [Patescibacteria group bacterium]
MTLERDFLSKLQKEAKRQASLNKQSLLPKQLQGLAALIAKYPWQTLLGLSFISALVLEIRN